MRVHPADAASHQPPVLDELQDFIVGGDPITRCAPLDHFGMAVDSLEEFEALLGRARAYRERDDRVELIDHEVEDHGVLKLHNFYTRYLFPLMVEIQHFEMTGGERTASESDR